MTAKFLTPLSVELEDEVADTWRLTQPLRYQSAVAQRCITVPAGFVTDFASVPRLPIIYLATGNTARSPAVVHDWLYTSGELRRSAADAVFLEAMKASGISFLRRVAMYAAVRAVGWRYYK